MKNFLHHFILRMFLGVLLFASGTEAQWLWQNPTPQGNSLTNVTFLDAGTGYAIGEGAAVLKTVDGGTNWLNLSVADYPGYTLMDLSFIDALTGWVTGYYLAADYSSVYGLVIKTTDGGASWTEQYNGFYKPTFSIQFFDADNGTVVGSDLSMGQGMILRTTDGGNTWMPQTSAFPGMLTAVYFTDPNTGTIVNDGGKVQRTTDGGATWVAQESNVAQLLTDVFFSDENTGTAVGGNGTIIRTTDGGSNWTTQTSGVPNQIEKVFFIDADNGWVTTLGLTGGGNVLHTTNGGSTWTLQFTTTYGYNGLEGIYFSDSQNGVLVGFGGLIYATTDAGDTWVEKSNHLTTEQLLDAAAVDQNTAYAVGTGGAVLKTTNGGNQWNLITSPGTGRNNGIYFLDAETGWIVSNNGGNIGGIFKTTDGGNTWVQKCVVYGNMMRIHFTDVNHGWAGGYISGETPAILKTTDGGTSWDSVVIAGAGENINSVFFVNNNTGWAVCGPVMGNTGGQIFKTTDGGDSWTEQSFPQTTPLNDLFFLDENTGWIAGGAAYGVGILLKTTDGGTNWVSMPYGYLNPLSDVEFIDYNNGTAVGDGVIVTSTDGGNTWNDADGISIREFLSSISFSPDNTGLIVGNSGIILGNNSVTPVELSLFTADVVNDKVVLSWRTSTETNNRGFEIERQGIVNGKQDDWSKIGFVEGKGTITHPNNYGFEDQPDAAGKYNYRLKQIDFDGAFDYSQIIEVDFNRPGVYNLSQNFPNPFNPATTINFSTAADGFVNLSVYNVLGEKVAELVNKVVKAGNHRVNFNAAQLSSGVYYYRMETNGYSITKKMMLLR